MEIERRYVTYKWIHGYSFKGDLLIKNSKGNATNIFGSQSIYKVIRKEDPELANLETNIKTLKAKLTKLDPSRDVDVDSSYILNNTLRKSKSGGLLDIQDIDTKNHALCTGYDKMWSDFIEILVPYFDAKINPNNFLESLNESSPLFNEGVKQEIKDRIIHFCNQLGFDYEMQVFSKDVRQRLEPTIQNIVTEALMLYEAIPFTGQEMLEDDLYVGKVNQSSLKMILTEEGYLFFVTGFWDVIWRGFSFDPKRAFTKTCKRCTKPFVGETTKRKFCSDTCKWNDWNDGKKAEKLGDKK